jgi:hypothetical protein
MATASEPTISLRREFAGREGELGNIYYWWTSVYAFIGGVNR